MASRISSLREKAAQAIVKNQEKFKEEDLRVIPNDTDLRLLLLDKLVTYDSSKKFLSAFGVWDETESPWEVRPEIVKRRWDENSSVGVETFRRANKRVMCVNKACLTDYGYVCATTTGRVIAYERDQVKPKELGNFKSRITHVHYHKERIFVIFLNWKVRMWVRTGTGWCLSVEYEEAVALRGWTQCVMSDGSVMAYTDGSALEIYKFRPQSASKMYSAVLHNNISHMSMCHGYLVYVSNTLGVRTLRIMDLVNNVGFNHAINVNPTCSTVMVDDDYVRVYVGFQNGKILSLGLPLSPDSGLHRIDRWIVGDFEATRVMSLKANKHRVASSHSDGKIMVFQHNGTKIRTIDVAALRKSEAPAKKKRKTDKKAIKVVINENRLDLDMDETRLLCIDGISHRVYCWDFSE